MPDVQLSNIKKLSSELGFSDDELQSRAVKSFRTSLTEFRIKFESQGNPLPGNPRKTDSKEAQNFALAFCLEQNRAETLWPCEEGPKRRPSWVEDRQVILRKVAHIFALQAFHKHQKDLKRRKKNMPLPADTPGGHQDERELSPESLKFTGPPPPNGTKRRPAKPTNPVAQNGPPKGPTTKACIKEIENLDPSDDNSPIREFTTQWLAKDVPRWPKSADIRMKYLMHLHNWYPLRLDEETPTILKMVNPLRKGSPIASCYTSEFNRFEERVRQRMVSFTHDLLAKRLIEEDEEGTLQKNAVFRDVWKTKHLHWEHRVNANAADSSSASAKEDVPNSFTASDVEDDVTMESSLWKPIKFASNSMPPPPKPKAKTPIKKPTQMQSNIYPIFNTSPTKTLSPARRTYDEFWDEEDSQVPSKKQRIDVPDTAALRLSPSPSRVPPSTSGLEKIPKAPTHNEEDVYDQQELESILREAQEVLSSNIGEAEKSAAPPPQHASEPRTPPPDARLLTPTSFEDGPVLSNSPRTTVTNGASESSPQPRDSASPRPEIKAHLSPLLSSMSEIWSPKSPFKRSISAASNTLNPNRQRLILVIQNSARKFDMGGENTLSSVYLRDSDVFEFFNIYAEKSKASYEMLNCLTFTFLFGEAEEMVVYRGDVEQWKRLKDLAMTLFILHKKRKPGVLEFKVSIEIGDKTVALDEGVEDDWGC